MKTLMVICLFVFTAAVYADRGKHERTVTVPSNKYTDAVRFYLSMRDAGDQLLARQAMIQQQIAEGKMAQPEDNAMEWLGFSIGPGVEPYLPKTKQKTTGLCKRLNGRGRGQALQEMLTVQTVETEDFWRAYYHSVLDDQARSAVDERMNTLADTEETTETDYVQFERDDPRAFQAHLSQVCQSATGVQ